MVTHVFDTSAILAHYFGEPGAEVVAQIWRSGSPLPAISAVTIPELRGKLTAAVSDRDDARRAADAYLQDLTVCLPVDRTTAEMAFRLRSVCPEGIPLVDALIAATARGAGAVLVHRDPHMARIPRTLVDQIVLPDA